jgi:hypothetical protein
MNTKKACVDCLYCKVSAKSTFDCRLCYCSQNNNKTTHKEMYWVKKNVCEKFVNMPWKSTLLRIFPIKKVNERKLLLRGKAISMSNEQ